MRMPDRVGAPGSAKRLAKAWAIALAGGDR